MQREKRSRSLSPLSVLFDRGERYIPVLSAMVRRKRAADNLRFPLSAFFSLQLVFIKLLDLPFALLEAKKIEQSRKMSTHSPSARGSYVMSCPALSDPVRSPRYSLRSSIADTLFGTLLDQPILAPSSRFPCISSHRRVGLPAPSPDH